MIKLRAPRVPFLPELAKDDDARVRHGVAVKHGCTAEILDRLCEDPDEAVRIAARRNRARKPPAIG